MVPNRCTAQDVKIIPHKIVYVCLLQPAVIHR